MPETKKNAIAIDFRQLLKQERAKARSNKKKSQLTSIKPISETNIINHDENKNIEHSLSQSSQSEMYLRQLLKWTQKHMLNHTIPIASPLPNRSSCINSIYYIPNFLPFEFSELLLHWLQSIPTLSSTSSSQNTYSSHIGKWTPLHHAKRKVLLYDATISPIPPPLQYIIDLLLFHNVFSSDDPQTIPNHILINEYQPGQGILYHTDGPTYQPKTVTISIGNSHVLFRFHPRYPQNNQPTTEKLFVSGRGSCLMFEHEAYTEYLHGIEEVLQESICSNSCLNWEDYCQECQTYNNNEYDYDVYREKYDKASDMVQRGYRISLTFRHKIKE